MKTPASLYKTVHSSVWLDRCFKAYSSLSINDRINLRGEFIPLMSYHYAVDGHVHVFAAFLNYLGHKWKDNAQNQFADARLKSIGFSHDDIYNP